MSNYMRFVGVNSNRGLSPNLWKIAPIQEVQAGVVDGCFVFDDFHFLPASGSKYLRLSSDSGASIAEIATEVGGVVRMTTGGTDNNEVYMNFGNSLGVLGKAVAAGYPFWFEARFRLGAVSDHGVFIGLAEEGLAVANTLTDDTGAVASKDYLGFRILTADSDGLDTVYRTAAGDEGVHKEAAAGIAAQTLTASTWVKVGMYFDGTYLWYFVNGDLVSTTGLLTTASLFPTGEELTFLVALKTGTGTSCTLDLDWFAFLQTA